MVFLCVNKIANLVSVSLSLVPKPCQAILPISDELGPHLLEQLHFLDLLSFEDKRCSWLFGQA